MLPIVGLVVLGESKVYDKDVVLGVLLAADQEVVRLDITMYDPFLMTLLNPLYHLQPDHTARLEVKLVPAGLK